MPFNTVQCYKIFLQAFSPAKTIFTGISALLGVCPFMSLDVCVRNVGPGSERCYLEL